MTEVYWRALFQAILDVHVRLFSVPAAVRRLLHRALDHQPDSRYAER